MSTVVRKQRLMHLNDTGYKKNSYVSNPYKAWEKENEKEDVFYVYILNFDNGSYYIGHSRELKGRILEIRNIKTGQIVWKKKIREVEKKTLEIDLK